MNDLYEQKAKKYKYKYLKLKKNYIGGNKFKFIGKGSFGCIISPPIKFDGISDDICDENHVAKLLSYYNYNLEIKEYEKIEKIDKEAKHRSSLKYNILMKKYDVQRNLKLKIDMNKINYLNKIKKVNEDVEFNSLTSVEKLYVCIKNRFLDDIIYNVDDNCEKDKDNCYGYIITTRVGKSFVEQKLGMFKKKQIITILTNLKESIGDLIQKLYDDGSFHGDIKFDNMTLDDKLNVYFIDFGFMTEYKNKEKIYNYSKNDQYPKILNIFKNIKTELTKTELINFFKQEYYKIQIYKVKNIKLDFSRFFESIDRTIPILEDNKKYDESYIYNNYIEPIAKNIDIYALSLFIYLLFINIYDNYTSFNSNNIDNFNNLKKILTVLLINALYNNIDGPEELIIYLDGIINNINNTYTNQEISTKIKERRKLKEKKYFFYYENAYFVDSIECKYKL